LNLRRAAFLLLAAALAAIAGCGTGQPAHDDSSDLRNPGAYRSMGGNGGY
jgi:hypothetical protein